MKNARRSVGIAKVGGLPVFALLLSLLALPAAAAESLATVAASIGEVTFEPQIAHSHVRVTVSGPQGFRAITTFGAGETPRIELPGLDGLYKYELRFGLPADSKAAAAMLTARENGIVPYVNKKASAKATVQSGTFRIAGGSVVPPDLVEPKTKAAQRVNPKGVLTNGDGVIRNSLCVGFDCPDAPAFSDSTILLMENNTRIKFGDTSNSPFPNNDWEIEANSSLSGGANYLGFNDCGSADNDGGCATDLVFAVESGARPSALYVESDGDVGIGTSNPVLDLHIVTGNTPSIRLDQDGTSGFSPQIWDIAGNEANFFIRDVTAGSRLPFRIQPGAPTNSIHVVASGDVGLGTASPAGALHVSRAGTVTPIFQSSDNGAVQFRLKTNSPNRRVVALNGADAQQSQIVFGDNGAFDFFGPTNADKRLSIPAAGVLNCAAGIKSDANGLLSCIVSSRQFKSIEGDLAPMAALSNVMALRPQVGSYKTTPDEPEHWLIAEDVAAVDPALVGTRDGKPYTVKTQNIVADLVAVIQEQQRGIEQQRRWSEQQQLRIEQQLQRIEALERAIVNE